MPSRRIFVIRFSNRPNHPPFAPPSAAELAIVVPDGVYELQPSVSTRIPPAGIPPSQAIANTLPAHESVKEVVESFPVKLEILKRPALLYAGYRFDHAFTLHGSHRLRVSTIDLQNAWPEIEAELVSLLGSNIGNPS